MRGLDEFRTNFLTVALRLRVEALGAVTEAVLEGAGGVRHRSGPLPIESDALTRGPAGSIKLVPVVAAPGHPLAQQGKIAAALLRDHVQLVPDGPLRR